MSLPARFAGAAVLLAGLLAGGCDRALTGTGTVSGYVVLRNGDSTDVRGSVVQLRRTQNIIDPPDYSQPMDSSERFYRASFVIPDVEPDSYYVFVWKNEGSDDTVSDGDFVGVYVGNYRRNELGSRLVVAAGDSADAGSLELHQLVQLTVDAWGERADSGRTTRLHYRFNHDVELGLLTVGFPDGDTWPDPTSTGPRLADSVYAVCDWRRGGAEMPRGWHGLVFHCRTGTDSVVVAASVFVH